MSIKVMDALIPVSIILLILAIVFSNVEFGAKGEVEQVRYEDGVTARIYKGGGGMRVYEFPDGMVCAKTKNALTCNWRDR